MKKLYVVLLVTFLAVFVTGCSSKTYKLNDTATIKENSIKLTVLGSEQVTIDRGEYSIVNGDYTKVKVSIKNEGTETFTWSSLSFSLGEEIPSLTSGGEEDALDYDIPSGQTVTGYIYFPQTEATELTYMPNFLDASTKYVFNIR